MVQADKLPGVLQSVAELVVRQLVRSGADTEAARVHGQEVAAAFCERFGGVVIYVPRTMTLKMALRNSLIRSLFDGRNRAALARQFRLSEARIKQIVARRRNSRWP